MRRIYQEVNERASFLETINDHTQEVPRFEKSELGLLRDNVFVRPRLVGFSSIEGYELSDTWDRIWCKSPVLAWPRIHTLLLSLWGFEPVQRVDYRQWTTDVRIVTRCKLRR
jgi:hypothetical protein